MKKIFTLSILLLSGLLASAQVSKSGLNDQVILVGNPCINDVPQYGLYTAHLERGTNQIVLVAANPFTCTYYAVYNSQNRLVASGRFSKRCAGDVELVNIGARPAGYRIVFSSTPLTACNL